MILDHCRPLLRTLLDIFFPPVCLGCGAPLFSSLPPLFCPVCDQRVTRLTSPLCPGCGRMFPDSAGGDHLCGQCLAGTWQFHQARSVLAYGDPLADVMRSFKYRGRMEGLSTFAALFARVVNTELITADWIIPVPLHKRRLRQRGFNQALLLARAWFPHRRQAIQPFILERYRYTEPQTTLSGRDRLRNVRGAFRVRDPGKILGKEILLVDDVFTTGNTVDACTRTLLKAGAARVRVLTMARVL